MANEPQTRLTENGLEFFKDYNQDDPDVRLGIPDDLASSYDLKLPRSLPADTKVLTVDSGGSMGFSDLGESTLSGTFHDAAEGAPGIVSGSDTLSTTAAKFDSWIFRNLVDVPPRIQHLRLAEQTTTSVTVCWDEPTVYELGVLQRTVPFIDGLNLKVFKSSQAQATNLSGTCATTAGNRTVAGTNTNFALDVSPGSSLRICTSNSDNAVSIAASGTSITGTGTAFDDQLVGATLTVQSQQRTIVAVVDASTATVGREWSPAIASTTNWSLCETRVVESIASATALQVTEPFTRSVQHATATTRPYETAASVVAAPLTTDPTYLPREGSATTSLSAIRLFLPNNGNSNVDGDTIVYAGPPGAYRTGTNT